MEQVNVQWPVKIKTQQALLGLLVYILFDLELGNLYLDDVGHTGRGNVVGDTGDSALLVHNVYDHSLKKQKKYLHIRLSMLKYFADLVINVPGS